MALIKCSECEKEVSSQAELCPNCGNPISNDNSITTPKNPKKQKTSKLRQILSWLLSILTLMIGAASTKDTILGGSLLLIAGLLLIPQLRAKIYKITKHKNRLIKTAVMLSIIVCVFSGVTILGKIQSERDNKENERIAKETQKIFNSNPSTIYKQITQNIEQMKYDEAIRICNKYISSGVVDKPLSTHKLTAELLFKLSKDSPLEEQIITYRKLVELNPNSIIYSSKLTELSDQLSKQKEKLEIAKAKKLAKEKEAIKKAEIQKKMMKTFFAKKNDFWYSSAKESEVIESIKQGADINATDTRGDTPLHRAILNSDIKVVKAMLSNGADINATNNSGTTPIINAIIRDSQRSFNNDMVTLLVNNNVCVDNGIYDGFPPLIITIRLTTPKTANLAKKLVEAGAKLNIHDKSRYTPIHYAVINKEYSSLIPMLVKAGANINIGGKNGQTPLHLAVLNEYKFGAGVVDDLIENGADVNAQNDGGVTPLFSSVLSSVDIEKRSILGKKYIANQGEMIMTSLLQAGADPSLKTKLGDTPLDLARGRLETINNYGSLSYQDMYIKVQLLERATAHEMQ